MEQPDLPFTESSYQTVPLSDYSPAFRDRAAALFAFVVERVGAASAKEHKGSYSIIAASSDATAAKVLIYESGKGRINGDDPGLVDGVYVLVRVYRTTGRTLGVAPAHHERFAYLRLHEEQALDEMADFIAACAGAQ